MARSKRPRHSGARPLRSTLPAQLHPIRQAEGCRHCPHRFDLAAHRVDQGELGLRQGDRHRQTGEAAAGAHIDHLQILAGAVLPREQVPQGPEAVEDLADPVVVALHQAGEVHAGVPGP
jgi:hypothetical protein